MAAGEGALNNRVRARKKEQMVNIDGLFMSLLAARFSFPKGDELLKVRDRNPPVSHLSLLHITASNTQRPYSQGSSAAAFLPEIRPETMHSERLQAPG